MRLKLNFLVVFLLLFVGLVFPKTIPAVTGREILQETLKRHFGRQFRTELLVQTFKEKKSVAKTSVWLIGRVRPEGTTFFLEFVEPEDARGLRFLFKLAAGKETDAFMFLPATGRTLRMAVHDSSQDVGGTGLSAEDLNSFIPQAGEDPKLVKEEEADGKMCYVIETTPGDGSGLRRLWISKGDLDVVKSVLTSAEGKVLRKFRVLEFFKTKTGRSFPRTQEIILPQKGLRVTIRHQHGLFGIEIPDELFGETSFGTCKWKL